MDNLMRSLSPIKSLEEEMASAEELQKSEAKVESQEVKDNQGKDQKK